MSNPNPSIHLGPSVGGKRTLAASTGDVGFELFMCLKYMDAFNEFNGDSITEESIAELLVQHGGTKITSTVFLFSTWYSFIKAKREIRQIIPKAFYSLDSARAKALGISRYPTIRSVIMTAGTKTEFDELSFQFFED